MHSTQPEVPNFNPAKPASPASPEDFAGQPAIRLRLDGRNSLLVALHGGHLLSWVADGAEQLYLSPRSAFDGERAIRGGVPVCFPQFNQRGPLPKHGFARHRRWALVEPAPKKAIDAAIDAATVQLTLALHSDATTLALWPHEFRLQLSLRLAPRQLALDLHIDNLGSTPLSFMLALHSYLRIANLPDARLNGLDGYACWDALADRHSQQQGALQFDAEFDRVFSAPTQQPQQAPPTPLQLSDGARQLHITQSASLGQTVVWNPGAALCARLPDMPADGFAHMLCVEAAQIEPAVTLNPGCRWQGGQYLRLGE